MDKQAPHYTVTIYTAAPGTPLAVSQGTSAAGHMYYSIFDGNERKSYGFAPIEHGVTSGPGEVKPRDVDDYKDPYYSRTMEVSKEQFEKLSAFGNDPAKHGFNMEYQGVSNSCIDFTWGALNHAGLQRKTLLGLGDKDFEGDLKVLQNIDDIKAIKAPFPNSPLNSEQHNKMPARTPEQWLLTEHEEAPGSLALKGDLAAQAGKQSDNSPRDPLLSQAEDAVRRLEQGLGRGYDANSACLAASAACLAKENGLSRIDHVLLSREEGMVRKGEYLFVVQGNPTDPAHHRAYMRTDDALAQPVEQSLAQLQTLNDAQRQPPAPQVTSPEQTLTPSPRTV